MSGDVEGTAPNSIGRIAKAVFTYGCIFLAGVVLAFAVAECYLHNGIKRAHKARQNTDAVVELDPELGWRNIEGRHTSLLNKKTMTIMPGGFRDTGSGPFDPARPQVLVLGCSFLFGYEIGDEDTFCWRLQTKLPTAQVINAAVQGYCTYQCLLRLEQYLASKPAPLLVVYGFIGGHLMRNVADPDWMWVAGLCTNRPYIDFPYCTIDSQGELVRHTPFRYRPWPLSKESALLSCLSCFRLHAVHPSLPLMGPGSCLEVSLKLMKAMDACCKSHGSNFMVIGLDDSMDEDMAKQTGVNTVLCASYWDPNQRVSPEDLHPNEEINRRWVECAGETIAKQVEDAQRSRKVP